MTTAVVIGGHVQGLSIVRSLGRRGIPVCLIDDTRFSIAKYSKYCQDNFIIKFTEDEEEVIRQLETIGRNNNFRNSVLFPTNDLYVAAISKYAERLQPFYRVITPPWKVVRESYDKRNTYRTAQNANIPIPDTFFPKNYSNLFDISKKVNYPFLLKPAVMHKFYRCFKKKLFYINSAAELEHLSKKILEHIPLQEIMIQEIIPGPSSNIYSFGSFYKNPECWVAFTNSHTRQYPVDFGTVATLVEFSDNEEVKDLGLKFLETINYYGLSEVEFKYDPRDNQFKLLDMNPRSWKQISLGNMAGLDLPYYAFSDAIGEDISVKQNGSAMDGRWVDFILDLYTSANEALKMKLNIASYLKSVKTPRTYAVWSKDDLMPFLMEILLFPLIWSKR